MASVLVVDDDTGVRDAFGRVLRHAGFEVTSAVDGVNALLLLAGHDFDVIVCDYKMPDLGGQGFYEQLEEKFPGLAGRLVFVTAYAEDPGIRGFLEQTGQAVLGKPLDPKVLVQEVRSVAAKVRLQRASQGGVKG
jgi:CheY-like chemotaxis protein